MVVVARRSVVRGTKYRYRKEGDGNAWLCACAIRVVGVEPTTMPRNKICAAHIYAAKNQIIVERQHICIEMRGRTAAVRR